MTMIKDSKPASEVKVQLNYELELDKDFKRNLHFYFNELKQVNNTEHLEEIIGEILYIGMSSTDLKTRVYINRKLKEIALAYPGMLV